MIQIKLVGMSEIFYYIILYYNKLHLSNKKYNGS
jgi:hypothetical protein